MKGKQRLNEDKAKKEQDEEAAKAYEEFVNVFQDSAPTVGKTWIKAGTFNAGTRG